MVSRDDVEFAKSFALEAGAVIVNKRMTTRRRKKLDRTDVTDVDRGLNARFIQLVRARGDRATVLGEEQSSQGDPDRTWIVDPVDGTGEYVNDSLTDAQRTTCFGLALLENGRLTLSVAYNPFRHELFWTTNQRQTQVGRHPITCSGSMMRRGLPYDYAHWDGARPDLRKLERIFSSPRGDYSAIYQACMVAAGQSCFAAFPGSTIHDIAPGALLVLRAGARVTDFAGNPLDWNDLSRGVLYANPHSQMVALQAIASL